MGDASDQASLRDLSSTNPTTRFNAAEKLAVPGNTFAVQKLMSLAKSDPDQNVRQAAIYALGEIGDHSAYSLLQSIWKNSSEPSHIRQEALDACDKLDEQGDGSGGVGGGTPARPKRNETGGF